MELLLTHNALNKKFPNNIFHLTTYYLPYARQDRACVAGEAFSLEVTCKLINSLEFKTVTIADVHSDIALKLLNNVNNIEQYKIVSTCVLKFDIPINDMVIVSPDKGAVEKSHKLAKHYNIDFCNAYKVRDPNTGQIINTNIHVDDFQGKKLFIVDDIADNGMTFYYLSKLLKERNGGKIILFVTHAIFPNGPDKLFEFIDEIYTTDSIYNGNDSRIKVLSI